MGIMRVIFEAYQSADYLANEVNNFLDMQPNQLDLDNEVTEIADLDGDFEKKFQEEESEKCKSELDRYLQERCEKKHPAFDILLWWKMNASNYQILSQIARDMLAIPVSTVASESAFSTGGHVLDQFRSSLTPMIMECLICTQDWLRGSPLPIDIEEKLEELQEIEKIAAFEDPDIGGRPM